MTNDEFSNQLDTLLDSYGKRPDFGEGTSKQAITLDEYEKSVLLTQAQDVVVKSYFDKTLNDQQQGFDDTPRRQVDFSSLIKVAHIPKDTKELVHDNSCYDDRGLRVTLPKRILFMLNERLEVVDSTDATKKKVYVVVPINYREYDRKMSKAYTQPLKKQAWRLFSNAAIGYDMQSEIIPIYGSIEDTDNLVYTIRYVKRPMPIILGKLPDGLTIDGYDGSRDEKGVQTDGLECTLNSILHVDILNKAFELAVASRGGNIGAAHTQQQRQRQE